MLKKMQGGQRIIQAEAAVMYKVTKTEEACKIERTFNRHITS